MTRALDLFAGPGGWDEGVRPLGLAPLGIEIDESACATGEAAGHRRLRADVAALDPLSVGGGSPVDGLLASPPCQGFSIAGKSRGLADARALLAAIPRMLDGGDVRPGLRAAMSDPRSILALEPLRWTLALGPMWTAWEQVPAVLPIWEASAAALRTVGYSTDVGLLSAEQFGLAQTRRRAFLVARLDGSARLPVPTHSRFHPKSPTTLDPGVARWSTMTDALGWETTDRVGFARRADEWERVEIDGVEYRARDLRPASWPANALTEKARSWVRFSRRSATEWTSTRLGLDEASVLQGFRPDYPWRGLRTWQFHQLGNAVPPPLAARIVAEVAEAGEDVNEGDAA